MLSTQWHPIQEMNRLRSEMDRLFGREEHGRPRSTAPTFPALNAWEDGDELRIEAELPGFEREEIEIYVTGDKQLSVSGERKTQEREGGFWHRRELGFGKFQRTFELPWDVDSNSVSATYQHGILSITLSKSEAAKPRRIEVHEN